MSPFTQTPATSNSTLVAGVDLLTMTEPDADAVLHELARELAALGILDPTLGTHRAQSTDGAHIALSIEIPITDPVQAWALLQELLPPPQHGSRGMSLGDRRSGPTELHRAAVSAAADHATRRGGRAAYFPGIDHLTGALTVRDLLARSSIEQVSVLAGGHADPDTILQTRDFVRPRWIAGHLVLPVQPGPDGTLVPFEVPNPTPCCADHAR